MKKFSSLHLVLIVFFGLNIQLISQESILLKGKLTEVKSKSPISAKIQFVDINGEVFYANSNSGDGAYEILLPSASSYDIFVEGYLAESDFTKFVVSSYSEYAEIEKDAALSKIKTGMEIFGGSIFEKNTTKFQANADTVLNYLKFVNQSKEGLVFRVILSSSDSYFSPKSRKENYTDKGKSKTRTVTISSEELLGNLIKSRKKVLKERLNELGIDIKNVIFEDQVMVKKPMPNVKIKSKTGTLKLDDIFNRNIVIKIEKIKKV